MVFRDYLVLCNVVNYDLMCALFYPWFVCAQEDDDQKLAIMRKAFQMFDTTKCGFIETVKISTILNTMGQLFDDAELQAMIDESDPECKCSLITHF